MNELFYIKFQGLTGVNHKIQIYDKDAADTGSATELINEAPGYKLSYDNGISDVIKFGYNTGELEFYVQNESGVLNDFLDSLVSNDENKYLVKLSIDTGGGYADKFYGVLIQDFGEIADDYNQSITFTAVDGLSFMKNVDYDQQSNFLEYITFGLTEIPTSEFYGSTDKFIFANTQWITDDITVGGATEHLARINVSDSEVWKKIKTQEGYNGEEITIEENSSYYEVIEHIITRFRAVLMFADGVWFLFQPDLYDSGTFRSFTKTGTEKATETVTRSVIIDKSNHLASGFNFSDLPALGEVSCNYLTKNDGSLVPTDFNFAQTYETPQLTAGSNNFLKIVIRVDKTMYPLVPGNGYFTYNLQVKIGSYYLQDGYSWTTSSNQIQLNSEAFSGPNPGGMGDPSGNLKVVIFTQDIPTTDIAEITLTDTGVVTMSGGIFNNATPSYKSWNITYSINNHAPLDYVSFLATNSGYNLKYELEDSVFGSTGWLSNGLLEVFTGSIWETTVNRLWNIEGNVPDQYFNELLVNETLSAQSKYKKLGSGKVLTRGSSFIESYQVVRVEFNGSNYYLFPNKISYNPTLNEWSGDWVELSRVEVRLSNDGENVGNGFPDNFSTSGVGTTLQTGYLQLATFDEGQNPTYQKGLIYYDNEKESFAGYNDNDDVTENFNRELLKRVKNDSGGELNDGDIVYISDAVSDVPKVKKAKADSLATARQVYVVTQSGLINNSVGYVAAYGDVGDIDTSSYKIGDQIYLSPTTAGAWTTEKPSYPNVAIKIGIVVRSNATEGIIYIDPDREIDTFTIGSIIYANGSGELSEDNEDLSYDPDTGRITAINTKMVAIKVHRTRTLTPTAAETWGDVDWNLKIAGETIDITYLDEGEATEDKSILVIDGVNDIMEIAGKAHAKWTGAAGTFVKIGIRILSSTDQGTTWTEARCSQNLISGEKASDVEDTIPFTSTLAVDGETYVKLQVWVSSTDMTFEGDAIFDNPVAITFGMNNIGDNNKES